MLLIKEEKLRDISDFKKTTNKWYKIKTKLPFYSFMSAQREMKEYRSGYDVSH